MKYYISQSPANPVARIFAALLAAVCLLGAFFFGLVILAVIAVVIALFSLIFWLRSWWLGKRGLAERDPLQPDSIRRGTGPRSQDFIEAEYTVVSERRD